MHHTNTNTNTYLLDKNMVSLSTPSPNPAVGGNPHSSAVQNPSSINIASSSPCAFAFAYYSNNARCLYGSFNSVYALQISFLHTNASKRSVMKGLSRWNFARGDMIWGWSMMKAGEMHVSSRNSPTSLSRRRAVVVGGGQLTWWRSTSWRRKALASSLSMSSGILTSRPSTWGRGDSC